MCHKSPARGSWLVYHNVATNKRPIISVLWRLPGKGKTPATEAVAWMAGRRLVRELGVSLTGGFGSSRLPVGGGGV
jgi:hypothetical protein